MRFNDHSELTGLHAFLSASQYHWVNYDPEKISLRYKTYLAAQKGTELHEHAKRCIQLGTKLARSKKTLNRYVNDAIGFRMIPEQVLFYSPNCFGTADAISFREDLLRIHDLKTGVTPVSMKQLEVYASLFCLEYHISPVSIDMELRIYQDDDVMVHIPEHKEILRIMDQIISFDKIIDELKVES